LNIQALPLALDALAGLAVPLAQEGKTVLALDLLTLALHHPAGNKATRDRAAHFLAQLKSDLPQAMAEIVETSAKDYTGQLECAAAAVLAELGIKIDSQEDGLYAAIS
jgi:hypothetical protein